jgi:hypothetical protein
MVENYRTNTERSSGVPYSTTQTTIGITYSIHQTTDTGAKETQILTQRNSGVPTTTAHSMHFLYRAAAATNSTNAVHMTHTTETGYSLGQVHGAVVGHRDLEAVLARVATAGDAAVGNARHLKFRVVTGPGQGRRLCDSVGVRAQINTGRNVTLTHSDQRMSR